MATSSRSTTAVLALLLLAPGRAGAFHPPRTAVPDCEVTTLAPDHPDEAMRWRRLAWLDEHGVLPQGALAFATAQRDALVALTRSRPKAQLTAASWTFRGPTNVAGRTRALVIHPGNPDVLWAGSVGGGVWKSTDRGSSWRPLMDFNPTLAVGCLVLDPRNPDVLLAGTGEGFFNGDALGGAGIFRSTDGGDTWAVLPATSGYGCVNRIAFSPADSNVLLAGTTYGGIQRSTDGGQTWTNVRWAQGCFDVDFHPSDPNLAVAHVIDFDWTANEWFHAALWSADGGVSWTAAAGLDHVVGFGSRIELAYARSQPSIVYAHCAADSGKVWRSSDGGRSFAMVTSSGQSGGSWYADALWVSPVNPDHLLVGGYHFSASTDGGQTLTQATDGYILTEQVHPDCHFAIEDPGYDGTSNRRVYATSDGGVFRTEDLLAASPAGGWSTLARTLGTSQFYGAAGDGRSGLVYGGTQDNGTLTLTSATTDAWLPYGGDGGFCAVDSEDPRFCYGEYINLLIHRSTDGGGSAGDIAQGIADAGRAANFIAPFILDPNEQGRMLAGGASLWRSDDVRTGNPPSWTAIRAPGSSNISAIAVAPGNSNVIWVAQNDARIEMTTDGLSPSPTWQVIDDNGSADPLPNRYPTRIVVDPDNPRVVYVAFGGFTDGNLQRTRDGGRTWTDVTGDSATGLPLAPIRGMARHPQRADWLYVGTEVGIFSSTDGGSTWSATNEGPANVSVDELTFLHHSPTLLAATHGRGLWTAETCVPAPAALVVTSDGRTAVHLSWTAVPGASEYHVLTAPAPGGPWVYLDTVAATRYDDRPPTGGRWYYAVRAFGDCESADSNVASADWCTPPRADVTAMDFEDCLESGVLLSWTAPEWNDSAFAGRRVTVWRDGAPLASGGCTSVPTLQEWCLDDTAGLGQPHVYELVLRNSCGLDGRQVPAAATDRIAVPQAVGGTLRVSRDAVRGELGVRWTDVPGADSYVVVADTLPGGSFATDVAAAGSGAPGATLPEPAGRRWYFLVAGVNACGRGAR